MAPARAPDPVDATLVPAASSAAAGDAARSRPVGGDPTQAGGPVQVVLAGYEILGELGRGGMGVVYRARQISLNRPVALKMILAGYQAGPRDRARFRSEAAAVAQVQHPHIVQVYEVGEEAGRPYLALELIEGTTLQQKLAGAPQPTGPAAHLVELLARAVHHAHQCGVVHRDLKPANVLLAAPPAGASGHTDPHAGRAAALYGVPKITDFGLAKRIGDDDGQTRSGDLLGTPSYMAPEQAAGKAVAAGPGADVYALGAILYEMLTGRPPFRGATPLETLHQVLHDDPVPPGRLRPKLPRDLERICLKCLEKDPRKRYASAQELADDLRRHLNGESVLARPAPVPERVWRWCRRNPVPAGLLAAAAIGSVSGLWYLSWLTRSVVRSTAIQAAAQQAETLDEVNKYYGLVARQAGGEKLGRGWQNTPGAVPFPATLTIELGQQITARSDTGTKVRLYSDFPFKNRTDGGPRDDFERDALARLRATPDEPFYRFEELAGQRVLRYATARRMTAAACVDCHNTNPESTKTDWKVGDVRGVLEVIRPLDRDQERVSQGLRGTALLIGGIGIGVVLLSAVTLALGTRTPRPPPADSPPPPEPDPGGGGPTPPPGGAGPTHPPRGRLPMPEPRDPDPVDVTLVPSPSSVQPGPGSTPDPEGTLLGP
ncbi:MAG: Serine/threonine protein kinase, partial [Gemmataceae bacterium]|nr:Serine/threonine protein kinase [Gemmataceae bacterium]